MSELLLDEIFDEMVVMREKSDKDLVLHVTPQTAAKIRRMATQHQTMVYISIITGEARFTGYKVVVDPYLSVNYEWRFKQ